MSAYLDVYKRQGASDEAEWTNDKKEKLINNNSIAVSYTHLDVYKRQTMMSVLTDRQREIIYYRYIKEMSIDEISKVTDMNNQSVSNSIQRALGRIRDLFKRK